MDFHLVRCTHEWLPAPNDALSPGERANVIAFWQVALDVVATRPRANLRTRDHLYPSEDERWVLESLAPVVLQLLPAENAEQIWQAIIDLHSEAHDWPEKFLNELHRRALSLESIPAPYEQLVREIALRALTEVDGKRRWLWHEEVWDALIGLDPWLHDVWAERHADHVIRIWDVISLWMEKAAQYPRRRGRFAQWLSKPAAGSIRLRVLPWLVSQLREEQDSSDHGQDEFENSLATLLNLVWDSAQPAMRASSEAFSAFRGLLSWLVERQNAAGLELQGRIGVLA